MLCRPFEYRTLCCVVQARHHIVQLLERLLCGCQSNVRAFKNKNLIVNFLVRNVFLLGDAH